ncbi:ELM1/GtrOC1 family putative glycosyltransferase [Methylopila sp. Yamaguchi]|uniref:ELM1/GtrOC1 family putative glycosyltransferase n=1 Tax=Methylopila sp. Yamaguchi TaxID=1437817 RepID=UPI000CB84DEA|nr:ELM1/GtrOC1 family putative glycosyltransferase [Methylopila sp. Yamaguchi]GBD49022.1 nucleoside-diphosphate-sugar epimerase-like protein [Methylopila sp. Yamaguchi]
MPASAPRLWALLPKHRGDARMVEAAAAASGLDVVVKRLVFNPSGWLLNLRSQGSLFSVKAAARAQLTPPWPDVVLTAGKRSVPVALWIRAASGGRTRLAHFGRPSAPLGWFDLVVTTPQYGLPSRANVLVQRFPPTAPPEALPPVPPDIVALPRPRLMAIAGGDADPQRLDADAARRFAADAMARATASGGSVLAATSPRTSPAAVAALKETFATAPVPARLAIYGEGADDYRAFLAAADAFLVTDDSASMIAEAAMRGAPVALFPLPRRPGPTLRAYGAVEAVARRTRTGTQALNAAIGWGLVRGNRDIDLFVQALAKDGLLDGGPRAAEVAAAELAEVGAQVRRLAHADHA